MNTFFILRIIMFYIVNVIKKYKMKVLWFYDKIIIEKR